MTSVVEFTYLYDAFTLSIKESALSRAVRVKNAVSDKIKRIYESKQVAVGSGSNVVESQVKESLIDLSQEKLVDLNSIINALQTQPNVSYSVNRAVLFTQPLVAKIFRVTDKWFDGMPRAEKENVTLTDIPSVDMINHLGGEVVPGNWNNVEEKEVAQENVLPLEPTLEAVPTINVESATSNVEIPTSLGNTDVYRFDFNMENLPSVASVTENKMDSNVSFDFVPEPKQIDGNDENTLSVQATEDVVTNNDFAFNLPSFEPVANVEKTTSMEMPVHEEASIVEQPVTLVSVPTSEMENKIKDLLNRDFTPNPANNFVPEHSDDRPAQDKIDDLLGRTSITQQVTSEVILPTAIEEPVVNQVKEDKPEITQGQVLARLRRLNNTLAEKDAMISSLNTKNDSLKEEVSASKDKISEYEVKVSDLTAKNSDLLSQNERLSAKLEEVETASKATILKLETKVSELGQTKTDELESLRRQLEELKEKHSIEISSMREKHALELKAVNDSKDKQIQAIYATISDALGDTSMEDDYSRSMAA